METEIIKLISCYSSKHGPVMDLAGGGGKVGPLKCKQITISVSRAGTRARQCSPVATAGVGHFISFHCKNRGENSR